MSRFFFSPFSLVVLLTLGLAGFFSLHAQAADPVVQWKSDVISLGQHVVIETETTPQNILTTVIMNDGRRVQLDPVPRPTWSLGLSPKDETAAREEAARILDTSIELALEGRLAENSVVEGGRVATVVLNQEWAATQGVGEVNPAQGQIPGAEVLNPRASQGVISKFKAFFSFLNRAIVLSTRDAYKEYRAMRTLQKGKTAEWGIQVVFKPEVQVGVGSVNITRNLPLVISIGYNKTLGRVVFRKGYRKEGMGEGSAMSVGAKVEVRFYRRHEGAVRIEGSSWYPPFIPIMSLVADSSPGYSSEGIAFGFNIADVIPGTYLMNTVNRFVEIDSVHTIGFNVPSNWADALLEGNGIGQGYLCSLLFKAVR
ncbi:MAG: hypothetical protein JNJ49_11075 [Bdellovibrionaceae bacterium]|nr:hypothetical protein [Pseudobdellovibrionaceae bacterium]